MGARAMGPVSGAVDGLKCGDVVCSRSQYCDFNEICEDCTQICDPRNSNSENNWMCLKHCDNYLHNSKYDNLISENKNLTATVETLEKQVHNWTLTCAILFCFVIALSIAVIIPRSKGFWAWLSKKFQRKKKVHCAAFTHENPHTESPISPHRHGIQQGLNLAQVLTISDNMVSPDTTSSVNNITQSSRLSESMAFTVSNPCMIADGHEFDIDQSQPDLAQHCQDDNSSNDAPQHDSQGNSPQPQNGVTLNVRNLNRLTSSHFTVPDTPETMSTKVDDFYLGPHTSRLPSEDCIVEMRYDELILSSPPRSVVNPIEYNSPQRQVIYTTIPTSPD